MPTPDELVEYLKAERDKLRAKKLTDFWVMADTDTFKPIKGMSEEKIQKVLMSDPEKYGKRKIASIRVVFFPKKSAIKNKDFLISFVIVVMKISSKGELKDQGQKTLCINYFEDDLEMRRFKFSDIKRFFLLCREGILNSETMNGIALDYALEKLDKKGINLDDVEV